METTLGKLRLLVFFFIIPCNHGKIYDVIVKDDFLAPKILKSIEILLSSDQTQWNFNSVVSPKIANISSWNEGNTHYWTTNFDPSSFSGNSIWSGIKEQLALEIGATSADLLHVRQVTAEISGRGDNTIAIDSCSKTNSNQEEEFVVVIFPMLTNWDKNSYGELVVYDDDGEILKSIHPKNGRVVLFDCGYSYAIKPPSMDCKERFHSLTIKVLVSPNPVEKPEYPPELTLEQRYTRYRKFMRSLVDTSNITVLDVERYITREFRTTKGHPIVVFDNIIPRSILDVFAEYVQNGTYANDPPSPESTDNVPWILAFDTEAVTESPLWKYVQAIVQYTSKKDDFYPYDVGCNNIRSHDTTKIHLDCAPDQEEYTMLVYLNQNWTNNDLGETVFFNYGSDNPNVRNEMVFAIKPKYGRVAIFHGTIPHSARPPTPLYHGARYTLAIKMASSQTEAFKKTMEMDMEPLEAYLEKAQPEEREEVQNIIAEIRNGKKSRVEVEQIVTKYEKMMEEM